MVARGRRGHHGRGRTGHCISRLPVQRPAGAEASFKSLAFRISGNATAQYYINVYNRQGKNVVATGWVDSPAEEKEVSLAIPDDGKVGAVEFYVQSKNGARAQNRIRQIRLEGDTPPVVIAAGMLDAGVKSARLDLRRAVATAVTPRCECWLTATCF